MFKRSPFIDNKNHCRDEEVKNDGSNLLNKLLCADSRSIIYASNFIISTALKPKNERISLLKECSEHYSLIEKKVKKHGKFTSAGEYDIADKALQIIRELYDRECFCDLFLDPYASSIEWLIKKGYLLAEPITDFPEKSARKCVIECPVCHSQYTAYEQYVGSWVEIRMRYDKIR